MLFDEPLSNLDAKLRRLVREYIRELQQSLGLTVVYVTHDQEEALECVFRMAQGERFATCDDVEVVHAAGTGYSVHFRARGPVLLSN